MSFLLLSWLTAGWSVGCSQFFANFSGFIGGRGVCSYFPWQCHCLLFFFLVFHNYDLVTGLMQLLSKFEIRFLDSLLIFIIFRANFLNWLAYMGDWWSNWRAQYKLPGHDMGNSNNKAIAKILDWRKEGPRNGKY